MTLLTPSSNDVLQLILRLESKCLQPSAPVSSLRRFVTDFHRLNTYQAIAAKFNTFAYTTVKPLCDEADRAAHLPHNAVGLQVRREIATLMSWVQAEAPDIFPQLSRYSRDL